MLPALSSSRFRLFSLSLLPSRGPTSLDLCFCRQHARSFSLFLYPRVNFCLLLMAGSRPRRDRFQLSRWPSNTPPPPILSLSICSFVHHCRANEHFFLYILTCIRPLYSLFQLSSQLLPVSAYIARNSVFHFTRIKSAIIPILNCQRFSHRSRHSSIPFPLLFTCACYLFRFNSMLSFKQNIWLMCK